MQLLTPQSATLTKTDSLQQKINFLEQRIDSLAKHTQVNEIGQNFFSDAISRDLYMFSTIVVIAGLVSWGFVAGALAVHKRSVKKHSMNLISESMTKINERISGIDKNVNMIQLDSRRSLHYLNEENGNHDQALTWAVKILKDIFIYYNKDFTKAKKQLEIYIEKCVLHLKNIPVGNNQLIKQITSIEEVLNNLISHSDEANKKQLQEILAKVRHIVYTIPDVNAPVA